MSKNTKIEWCDATFNPWRGCTKVSAGCASCYAETLSGRNPKTLGVWGPNGTRVVASESMWREPVKWNRQAQQNFDEWKEHSHAGSPRPARPRVFCASLADVFEDWTGPIVDTKGDWLHQCDSCKEPDGCSFWMTCKPYDLKRVYKEHACGEHLRPATMQDVRTRLFRLIDATPNLDWLLLTKRPENISRMMPSYFPGGYTAEAGRMNQEGPRPNVWLGTSVENQQAADERIPHLLRVPAAVRFLSCEPLLGPVNLSPTWIRPQRGCDGRTNGVHYHDEFCGPRINWVIVGGESGPGARPMHPDWARSLRDQCQAAGVPFFFKQWGEYTITSASDPKMDGIANDGKLKIDDPALNVIPMARVGKRAAGRLLDCREWSEFPAVEAAS